MRLVGLHARARLTPREVASPESSCAPPATSSLCAGTLAGTQPPTTFSGPRRITRTMTCLPVATRRRHPWGSKSIGPVGAPGGSECLKLSRAKPPRPHSTHFDPRTNRGKASEVQASCPNMNVPRRRHREPLTWRLDCRNRRANREEDCSTSTQRKRAMQAGLCKLHRESQRTQLKNRNASHTEHPPSGSP